MDELDKETEEKIIQLQDTLVRLGFTTLKPAAAMELFLMIWNEMEN